MRTGLGDETLCERYIDALLQGNSDAATRALQEGLLQYGFTTLYSELIAPTQQHIGELWRRGEINIAQEHLATQMVLGHLERLRHASRPKQSLGLRAVVTTVQGDAHFIGARIASDLFYFDGWQVDFLGCDTPTADLVEYAKKVRPELVGLSATTDQSAAVAADVIERIKALEHKPLVILGGLAARAEGSLALGADLLAASAEEAVADVRRTLGLEKPEWGLDSYLEVLGRRVQSLRKARGWSQRELASAAGLDRTYVSSVEHGKQNLTLSVALKLADALSVPLEWLLSEGFVEMTSNGRDFLA